MSVCPEKKQLKKVFRKHLIHSAFLETAIWILDKAVCQSRLNVTGIKVA